MGNPWRTGGGDAGGIFLKKNQVALGWEAMGDLGTLATTRDAFKEKLIEAYPDRKPGYYPMATGQLFRFVHEIKAGDLIVYPSKRDKRVYVGEVTGPYLHVEKGSDSYPHRRAVKWLKEFPRTKFTQVEAKYKGMMPLKRVYVPEPLEEAEA